MNEPKRFSEPWYVTAMDSIESSTDENSLLELVHEEMAQFYDVVNDREFKEISEKYSNSRLILYKIVTGIQDSEKAREGVLKGIQMLRDSPLESYVSASVDCHLRMSNRRKNKSLCPLCSIHEDIEAYEKSIFHFVKGDLKSKKLKRSSLSLQQSERLEEAGVFLMDNQRVGNWTDSETERLLRAVLKFIRSNKGLNSILIEEGNKHLSFIEATKKEFKLIRVLWRQVSGMVAAMDELNMCVMRLQLR
ncbi:SNF2 histone linker PHD RING helicase_ E3 ubiquitin protein ligase, partial [Caligus rogercresseyi]